MHYRIVYIKDGKKHFATENQYILKDGLKALKKLDAVFHDDRFENAQEFNAKHFLVKVNEDDEIEEGVVEDDSII